MDALSLSSPQEIDEKSGKAVPSIPGEVSVGVRTIEIWEVPGSGVSLESAWRIPSRAAEIPKNL